MSLACAVSHSAEFQDFFLWILTFALFFFGFVVGVCGVKVGLPKSRRICWP